MSKLFVSHAAHDKPLVEVFIDLLESGVGVPHKQIFCSSLKGQSIKPGGDFVESIRSSLDDSSCVVALITEAYYASAFCMCELGGVWLQNKSFLPVIVPPLDYSRLKAVLGKLQVSRLNSSEDLDELRDELAERLGLDAHSTPRWNMKRKAFLGQLKGILKKTSFEGPVDRDTLKKVQAELNSYRKDYEAQGAEIEDLRGLVAKLTNTKDADEVRKVMCDHSTSGEAFESLVLLANSAMVKLSQDVCQALYYRGRGEAYEPRDREDWDDVMGEVEEGLLETQERGVIPREDDPMVAKAIAALDELSKWLDESPEDFFEWYELETEGERPDITLRPFWRRHFR